ncbi:hypothetical protein [Micromonospora zingiberis]|uniref:hypothetical protein n=1 Tax=Micromonospora zingiberis TaxID=2053011 RepID=UPI00103884FD|nr:hypothetical protein [Micromonospora zingiberis]
MVKLARLTMVVVLASMAAACDSTPEADPTESSSASAVAPTGSPGDFAAPPLRLPSGGAGDACPVTEPRPWDDPEQASRVLGPGPVYPIADYFTGGVLPLRDSDRRQDGSYQVKVRWLYAGYTGPVLVRAGRIDAPGTAAAEFSYLGEPRHGGHYAVLPGPAASLPGTTTVSGPGCYAYQVDSPSFSYHITFRAAPTP